MNSTLLENNISLAEALDFEHEADVIDGFMSRYNVSEQEAIEIFEETKKWLWLASKSKEEASFNLAMESPLMIIDEMWHNFILYTKHYHQFCMGKLNKFIHHIPTPSSHKEKEKLALAASPLREIERKKKKTYRQLSFIYDKLGPETVIKWYEELPSKYTPEYIQTLKK